MTTDELNIIISADTGNAAQNIGNTADELNRLGETAQTADGDMSALVKAMSEAAAQMVAVSQNIAASASGVSGFQGSFEALNVTLQGISGQFDTLNATIQAMSFGDAAARVADLSVASEQSANALNGISTAADDFAQHMTTLSDATKGTADGMDALTGEFSTALASIKNFSSDMSTAGQEAQETAQKIKDLAEQVNKIPKGSNVTDLTKSFRTLKGVIATLGIGAFIKDSQAAYETQMTNELKLTSHMKHRMQATDDEIASIKELASAQQKLGVIGDEIQLAGAQQLTTYARQSSTLKTLIPAMNNLIAQQAGYEASVGDAVSAADMLGRALGGQYTMLRRMGITFTEAQENVLKYGTETQKAAVLADAINAKVGNMNELLAQTPTGKMKQLQNELGDFQEELTATWQPLITAGLPVLRGSLDMIKEPIKDIGAGITALGSALAKLDSPIVRTIGLTAAGIALLYRLKLLIGGTSAGLLVLGVALAGIIGKAQAAQVSVSDVVTAAMNSAEYATNSASEAMDDYTESTENARKAISRLAGFDTITKLTGGTQGTLGSQLFNENDLATANGINDALQQAANAAADTAYNAGNIKYPEYEPNLNWFDIIRTGWDSIFGTGQEFWDNWEIGARQFTNSWNSFWETWRIGYEYLFSDRLVKDIGSLLKNTPFASVPQLKDLITLMSEYGVRSSEELMMKDFAAYADYMEKYQNFPKRNLEFEKYFEEGVNSVGVENAMDYAQHQFIQKQIDDGLLDGINTPTGINYAVLGASSNADRYDVPTKPVGMPTSAYEQMQATIIMDGEVMGTATMKIQEAQSLESNGLYGGR